MICLGITHLESGKSYLEFISSDSTSSAFFIKPYEWWRRRQDRWREERGLSERGEGEEGSRKEAKKIRGAEDEAVRGAANSYGKNRLKNS